MNHITFDLETLGTGPNSPIIQIGAARFNEKKIIDTFKRNILWKDLENYDFDIDYSTVYFWMSQDNKARESVLDQEGALSLSDALMDFMNWVELYPVHAFWSHATFDAPILANACRKARLNVLPYRKQRDIRTLNMLAGEVNVKRPGTHHDAEDDAVFQALYIMEMLKKVS